jgi:hypothetical protein
MTRRRLTTVQAAEELGVTVDAMRSRIRRGNIESEKDPDGRVYVWLSDDEKNLGSDEPQVQGEAHQELVGELRDRVRSLERQLDQERQAHAEARRIMAGLVERIPPALEAPSQEPSEGPAPASEESGGGPDRPGEDRPSERRSWWRRWFGG